MKRGKNYKALQELLDSSKSYSIPEAIAILGQSKIKFDQTVEVHMNLGVDPRHSDQVVRGNVALPNGTGKDVKVLVFAKGANVEAAKEAGAFKVGAEDLVEEIQGGWLDFDVVVATPDTMPIIGRLARILGPRGLMPSPKNGTVTPNVTKVINELKAGKISYRVDKGSNVHAPVGKLSFEPAKLAENIESFLENVIKARPASSKGVYIKSLTLTATHTPAISLDMALTRSK
jgi:large subunit ribosomal protein L1